MLRETISKGGVLKLDCFPPVPGKLPLGREVFTHNRFLHQHSVAATPPPPPAAAASAAACAQGTPSPGARSTPSRRPASEHTERYFEALNTPGLLLH